MALNSTAGRALHSRPETRTAGGIVVDSGPQASFLDYPLFDQHTDCVAVAFVKDANNFGYRKHVIYEQIAYGGSALGLFVQLADVLRNVEYCLQDTKPISKERCL